MPELPKPHARDSNQSVPDPYRFFFPFGILVGVVGVGVWPVYAFGLIRNVQSWWHIDLQIQGFLFAFVLGFLLTALPRFSMTAHASSSELTFFVTMYCLSNLFTAAGWPLRGRVAFFVTFTGLFIFALRRFRLRKSDPPPQFVFVLVALLAGYIACIFRIGALLWPHWANLGLIGRRLFTEGMMLLLILGIGGKLIPLFFGFAGANPVITLSEERKSFTAQHAKYLSVALLLIGSFVLEYFYSPAWGLWIRVGAASLIFLGTMKLHRKPKNPGVLVHVLRFSNWAVYLALWGAAIHPNYRVEVLHVLFIAGFGVMILGIATRVTLSHGGYPPDLERRSFSLLLASILLAVAMIFRSLAMFFAETYFEWLAAAGIFWIIGLLIWGTIFSRRAISVRPIKPI